MNAMRGSKPMGARSQVVAAIAICFGVTFAAPASAGFNLAGYRQAVISHPAEAKTYVVGVQEGYSWANVVLKSKGQPPLYCVPGTLVQSPDLVLALLNQEIENGTYSDESPIELILLAALGRAFPCD